MLLAGCGDEEPPAVPVGANGKPDAELVEGRAVWGKNCATCHGADGRGGRGKKLNDGRAVVQYPDIEDQIDVVVNGKGNAMPSFNDRLSEEEIQAVVRYTREVL